MATLDETLEERVERYRRMADSTRHLAHHTDDPEIEAAYLDLAAKWERLARQAAEEATSLVAPDLEPRRASDSYEAGAGA